MSSKQQPIIWNNWQEGIADSPHVGTGLIRNADIESFPGALKAAKKPQTHFITFTTQTFTADAASDVCTAAGSLSADNFGGTAVYFTTTGTLPAGLTTGKVYFLIYQSATTFKVAVQANGYKNSVGSAAGTAINITDAGTGTHTVTAVAVGTINWIKQDPRDSYYFAMDSNGRMWFVPSGTRAYLLHNDAIDTGQGTLTNAAGGGMALFATSDASATYLFTFRNAVIDVINVFGNTAIEAVSWSNSWKTMNSGAGSGNSHETKNGQDNIIYFCDDRYVGSIKENAGSVFDPATAGTYTYNNQALDLPQSEVAQCLEEQGTNLLIGGQTFNQIYPWDRISDSYNLPLAVPEWNIRKMQNIGGTVYILPGTWGNIYTTQGTYVKHFKKIPTYVVNNALAIQSNPITWGGAANSNGALVFGLTGQTANSSGIYRLWPDGRLVHDNTPASGSTIVKGLFARDDFYYMGYSGGFDNFSNTQLYNNYETVAHSPFYKVGTKIAPGTFSRLEAVIDRPTTSGNLRIGYRTDLSSSFTTLATYSGDGTTMIFETTDIGLIDIQNIQLQVELSDGGVAIDMELLEIRLIP